jgi:hypothetical protein
MAYNKRMKRSYKGVIFTNHALERLRDRSISQATAWATLTKPDRSRYASSKKAWIYNRTFGSNMVEVVASQNEQKEWVIVSVWSRPLWKLEYTKHKYQVRHRFLDWLIDKLLGRFKRS